MKRSLSEMYDDAEAKAEKKRQEHMTRILKRSETVQEKNHYFSDELWLSLENKTLSEKFLRRFSKQFRQRLNYQLKKYIDRIAQWMAKAYGYAAKKKEAYKSKEVNAL